MSGYQHSANSQIVVLERSKQRVRRVAAHETTLSTAMTLGDGFAAVDPNRFFGVKGMAITGTYVASTSRTYCTQTPMFALQGEAKP